MVCIARPLLQSSEYSSGSFNKPRSIVAHDIIIQYLGKPLLLHTKTLKYTFLRFFNYLSLKMVRETNMLVDNLTKDKLIAELNQK